MEGLADVAIGLKFGVAAALDDGGVHRGPVFDLDGQMASVFEGAVVGLGGEGDNEVEAVIIKFVKGLGAVFGEVDAKLVHDTNRHGINLFGFAQATGINKNACAEMQLHQPRRNG
ncbi:MAG: hypothetical protein RLZZ157_133 [Pseudomonadota bacterium]